MKIAIVTLEGWELARLVRIEIRLRDDAPAALARRDER